MASIPVSQGRFSDAQLLLMAKDVLDTIIFPMLINVRGGHNDVREEVSSDSEGVITIPERSYLNGFNKLKSKASNTFLNEVAESGFEDSYFCYYFIGDSVITSLQSEDFVMTYTLRPPQLILETDAPKVVSFNTTTRQVEVDVETFESSMDVIGQNGYTKALNVGRSATTSSTLFTLGGTIVPSVGDYICAAGESPLIPVPQEVIGYFTRVLCSRILQDIPDVEGFKQSMEIEMSMHKNIVEVLKPRGRKSPIYSKHPFINSGRSFRRYR